jgi:hypothetical protein
MKNPQSTVFTKDYNREVVYVYINNKQFCFFAEEGNLSKNEANADKLIDLLKQADSQSFR